ncbi:MAG TPA: tyrosine-type recombinase/integrase [Kofleriaceae bacterium]
MADYLRVRRTAGFKLKQAGEMLPAFVDYLDKRRMTYVTTVAAIAWATQPRDVHPNWWRQRLVVVRGFARYLQTIDRRTEMPSLDHLPASEGIRSTPYVYSAQDITALLSATDTLRTPLRVATYRTLLGLLAVTGMRVGEAIALDERDFDRRREVLVIRKSKFDKSREVPLHASTVRALERYLRDRNRLAPRRRAPSLFVSLAGSRLFYQNVHETFLKLVYAAGLGDRRPRRPHIHDLRHSFAIRTVLDWYRDDVDVEARLPLLSTYLGHIGPSSTYWYLTAVPELLEAATVRLERSRMKS